MTSRNCDGLIDSLSEYLDEEARARLCNDIQHHMAGRKPCRVVLDTLHKTIELYHALPQPEVPESSLERLCKTLDLAAYRKTEDPGAKT
jgi:hypothetical protein